MTLHRFVNVSIGGQYDRDGLPKACRSHGATVKITKDTEAAGRNVRVSKPVP